MPAPTQRSSKHTWSAAHLNSRRGRSSRSILEGRKHRRIETKADFTWPSRLVRFGSKLALLAAPALVRSALGCGHPWEAPALQLQASSKHSPIARRESGEQTASAVFGPNSGHSITWSVSTSMVDGIVRPRERAVLRFTINSNFVGNWIGISSGLRPFRIKST